MASNTYTQHTADGKTHVATRSVKQGRKLQGFGKEREVRLYDDSDATFAVLAKEYGEYWNANQFIRDAVRAQLNKFPYAELLNT